MSLNIVFVDSTTEYPFRFSAGNTKVEMLSLGLQKHQNNRITVINSPFIGENIVDKDTVTTHNNIESYSFNKKKSISSIVKNFKLFYNILKSKRVYGKENIMIVSDPQYFTIFLIDILFAKILKYKIVRLFHEWHSSVKNVSKKQKLGFYFLDNYFGYFCDAILPISHFLEEKSTKFKKPTMLVPILAEFKKNPASQLTVQDYFVYCVGAQYFHVINRLLEHLKRMIDKKSHVSLVLVLYGEKKFIDRIEQQIELLNLKQNVTIKSKVPQEELYALYKEALGLIIPLEDTIQDKARFSQKIAEYIGSQRPIITNNIGEIPFYFQDKENAVFATPIESDTFVDSLFYLVENPEKATEIGKQGFLIGEKYFNYLTVGEQLNTFLANLK